MNVTTFRECYDLAKTTSGTKSKHPFEVVEADRLLKKYNDCLSELGLLTLTYDASTGLDIPLKAGSLLSVSLVAREASILVDRMDRIINDVGQKLVIVHGTNVRSLWTSSTKNLIAR